MGKRPPQLKILENILNKDNKKSTGIIMKRRALKNDEKTKNSDKFSVEFKPLNTPKKRNETTIVTPEEARKFVKFKPLATSEKMTETIIAKPEENRFHCNFLNLSFN
jgi:hypothetical protein